MDGVEDAAAPRLRDEGTGLAAADIADQVDVIDLDSFEAESGVAVLEESLSVGVRRLIAGERDKIHALGTDGVDGSLKH